MNKYEYDTAAGEKLTEVRVHRVWLDDLLPEDSAFNSRYHYFWQAINDEVDIQIQSFILPLKDIKRLICSGKELYIVYIVTESMTTTDVGTCGQSAYLTNGETFISITWLLVFTSLLGCEVDEVEPPYEDFIIQFIGEMYF